MHEASLCPCGCGFPREKAWDPESDGWLEARTRTCFAKAAAERWRAENAKEAEPGTLLYVTDTRDSATDGAHDQQHEPGDAE